MPVDLWLLVAFTLVAAFTQGFCGFGYGIIVMALLSLVTAELERASVFVTLSIIVVIVVLMLRSQADRRVDWKRVGLAFCGIMVGSPLGYWFVLRCDKMPVFRVAFGVALILFALNGIIRPHIKRYMPLRFAPAFGVCSGLLSGAFASGGPPLVLYFYAQEDDPRLAVSSLQAVFMGAAFYRVVVILLGGKGITGQLLTQAACAAPFIVVVTMLGYRLSKRVTTTAFMIVVYALVILAGVINVAKGVHSIG